MRNIVLLLMAALFAGPAPAHRPSDAFVTLDLDGRVLHGRWEIALRDLAVADDIDANHDGSLTWGELRGSRTHLDPLLLAALQVEQDGRPCALRIDDLLVNDRIDGRFASFGLAGECPAATGARVTVRYRFLFDLDPSHRGIIVVNSAGTVHNAVLGPDHDSVEVTLAESSALRQFLDYLREGVHHIWIGADHVLFLLSLLLPAVLVRGPTGWEPAPNLRLVLLDVLGVVTAFTLAHSITLTLAALQLIRLPGALTESAIAASVFLAAMNNVVPLVTRLRWAVAFTFGLVHGFGFASVLSELGLPQGSRLLSLVGFNVGVEIGQLGIVLCVVPLIFAFRRSGAYPALAMRGASLVIAAIAAFWFAQRTGLVA